ncbi:MAG: Smr/MutS family protein [Thermodesulfobacteriota bacterium]|nr:Smr/MutS family protein [Thermodesulfobacteriota bacterium]
MKDDVANNGLIKIPIDGSLDLHTFSPKEIPSLLEEYFKECLSHGIFQVRIIHGKGRGVQRRRVNAFLEKNPLVHSYCIAPPEAGGWGATIAFLQDKKKAE